MVIMAHPELRNSKMDSVESVAIIGGGIATASVCFELLRQNPNLKIDIYCKDHKIAEGASGNRQGAVYPLLQGKGSPIANLHAAAFLAAIEFYQLTSSLTPNFAFQQSGVLQQAMTEELETRYQQVAQFWSNLTQFVDAKQSSSLAGLDLPYPSLWFKQGGWIAPYGFCEELLSHLINTHNVNVKLASLVTEVKPNDPTLPGEDLQSPRWQVYIDGKASSSSYDAVVFCGGHQSTTLGQLQHLPIEPIRGQVSQLNGKVRLAKLKTVLCHKGYVTPSQGEYLCFGATFSRGDDDLDLRPQDDVTNMTQIQRVYPQQNWIMDIGQQALVGSRAGVRANSADHLPIAGEIFPNQWVLNNVDKNNGQLKRKDKLQFSGRTSEDGYQRNPWQGLYTITGLGARGLTTAPLMAKHVASLICNNTSPLSSDLVRSIAPIRFQTRRLKREKGALSDFWQSF